MKSKSSVCVIVTACALASAAQAECVWGSFDSTRINYPDGVLNGSAHTTLAGIINAGGGTLAASTSTLTAAYLSSVDVFYTSLFRTDGASTLSAAEQAAVQSWFFAGGTLIVTADIFAPESYDSLTSFLGVTNYNPLSNGGNATVINSHALTAGVTSIAFTTESTFSVPATALALANGPSNQLFSAVMDPSTGYNGGGRLFIVGDHNMFTNSFISSADNTVLAQNMASWACIPAPGVTTVAAGMMLFGAARRRR